MVQGDHVHRLLPRTSISCLATFQIFSRFTRAWMSQRDWIGWTSMATCSLSALGKVDNHQSLQCLFVTYTLLVLSVIMVSIIGFKFLTFISIAEVQSQTDSSDWTARTELTVRLRFWFPFGLRLSVPVHSSGLWGTFENGVRTCSNRTERTYFIQDVWPLVAANCIDVIVAAAIKKSAELPQMNEMHFHSMWDLFHSRSLRISLNISLLNRRYFIAQW